MVTPPPAPGATPRPASSASTPERRRNPKGRAALIIALVLVAYVVLFLILNSQSVTVHFVVFTTRLSLFWALALAAGSGVLVGLLIAHRRNRGA